MIFSFADLIAYITTFMTLKPGDIVVTGTPVKKPARARSAGLAQAGRYDRGRVSADRRAAQFRGGRERERRWPRRPRGLRDRLAGRAFALAADPQVLAQALRDGRRLSARSGDAEGVCRLRRIARRARLCRRQRHRAAQGSGTGAVGARRSRARRRGRQHLWLDHGVLRSTNTDVEGFLANLDAARRAGIAT